MEPETLQQRALDVRQPDENFDPNMKPQDGEEYIMQVIYERRQCPGIVVVRHPKGQDEDKNTDEVTNIYSTEKIPNNSPRCLRPPTTEWMKIQLKDFSHMRAKILRIRANLEREGYSTADEIPLIEEADQWHNFCQQNSPLLSIMLRIDQRSLENLLEFQSTWLCEEDTIDLVADNNWLGAWIYSTFVCLQLPIEPRVHSSLRDIAKFCILQRNKLSPDDTEKASAFNIFILIKMKRRFHVKIYLDLHSITCPGVWLCPSGYVECTIKTLGYYFKTGPKDPKFPIFCHDLFVIEGSFKSIESSSQLEKLLFEEGLEISLWQSGRRLSNYSGKLGEILQPNVTNCFRQCNVQIIMNASSCFPGIIGPKVELAARTLFLDRSKVKGNNKDGGPIIIVPCCTNPKTHFFYHNHNEENIREFRRQKPVCHVPKDYKWMSEERKLGEKKLSESRVCNRYRNKCLCMPETNSIDVGPKFPHNTSNEFISPQWKSHAANSISDENVENASQLHEYENEYHKRNCETCSNYREMFNSPF